MRLNTSHNDGVMDGFTLTGNSYLSSQSALPDQMNCMYCIFLLFDMNVSVSQISVSVVCHSAKDSVPEAAN